MASPKKAVADHRKYRSKNKFRGKRRRTYKKATANENVRDGPAAGRPNIDHGNVDHGNCDDEINAAVNFVSASQKKIALFENDVRPNADRAESVVLCELGALTAVVAGAACPVCHESKLAVRAPNKKRKGLSAFLELHCENAECSESILSSAYSSKRVASDGGRGASRSYDSGSSRDAFAVNLKVVLAARAVGIGHEQLSRFCAVVGLPNPMHHKTFHAIGKKIHSAAVKAVCENMQRARSVTKEVAGNSDVPVMFDGTWQKRGHKSHNGVGTVVSLDTGLCLDYEVLSNFCLACSLHNDMGGDEETWQAFHHPVCEKNCDCSSHAMEAEAAVRIWQRTVDYETPLRFTIFLSDGDSKAYNGVCDANVYPDTPIEKEECTNHVAKRLGTGLRKLPTPLPRGEKLKETTIQKLQTYFQVAIVNNRGNVHKMYTAIWASCLHSCSTDGAGSHKFCPAGPDSWCKHRRAEAQGQPAPCHTPLLTKAQGLAVLPIYKRLTDAKLLARCLHGKTQNAAESLNSKIWLLCPKTRFASRTAVETATAIAVLWFNRGHASFEKVLEELGVLPSEALVTLSDRRDSMRMHKMNVRQTAEARAHRRSAAKRARVEESCRTSREGKTYGAGEF
ncbi:uncharacterized protein LOC119161920 [Rhipicephalus microplus]|uniref:uncharacterized protein LOC119161920 n=3 Tax=Rhipicephalus microplus TaxID=6941 RepID=UPI00237656D4